MTPTDGEGLTHNLRAVTPVLTDDGAGIVGYVGHCVCTWSTDTLPKDQAWSALGDHVTPSFLAAIPPKGQP